jgi:hypothetical protein
MGSNALQESSVYGDMRILNPGSDLSFDDGSAANIETAADKHFKDAPDSFDREFPTFFKADSNGGNTQKRYADCGRKENAEQTDVSRVLVNRFKSILSRSNDKTRLHPVTAQRSTESHLKRKSDLWLKTRQTFRKRFKYNSFWNDLGDGDDDSFIQDHDELRSIGCFPVEKHFVNHNNASSNVQLNEQDLFQDNDTSSGGAYDDRPILNDMFHSREHDDSFHRERKLAEPLLKAPNQLSRLSPEDRNPPSNFRSLALLKWPMERKDNRDLSSMLNDKTGTVKNPLENGLQSRLFDSSSNNSEANLRLKGSSVVSCGCLPRNRMRRSKKKRRSRRSQKERTGGEKLQKLRCNISPKEGDFCAGRVAPKLSAKEKLSLLDEESLQRELRELDILANEVYRNSPELLKMPVDSQLSAIAEVDEDLTQKSSTVSAHSSIDMSQHLRNDGQNYASLAAMLENERTSIGTDEPYLFSMETNSQRSASPTREKSVKKDEHAGTLSCKKVKKTTCRDPNSLEKRRGDKKFRFKGEEITVTSTSDDDSTSGISDITEDFLQIPVTSPLFKKAMEMFREVAAEEGRAAEDVEESRDDLDGLNHIVTLQL